jgi:hypothetical protein
VVLALAALVVLALAGSFVRPAGFAVSHVGARVSRGSLELAWTNADIGYASAGWRLMAADGSVNARMVVGPAKWWRPVVTKAGMSVGSVGAVKMFTLRAAFVPLWMIVLPLGGVAYGLWRVSKRPVEGRCAKCGYELAGVRGGCPECGEGRMSRVRRMLKALGFSDDAPVCSPASQHPVHA